METFKWLQDWSGVLSLIPLFGLLLWPINSLLSRRNAVKDREKVKSFLEIKREINQNIKYNKEQKSYGEWYVVDIRKRQRFTSGQDEIFGVSSGIKSEIMFVEDDYLEVYHNFIFGYQSPDETWKLSKREFVGSIKLMVCGLIPFDDVLAIDMEGCRRSQNDPIIYSEFFREGILKGRVKSVFKGYRLYAQSYSGQFTDWISELDQSHYRAMLKREKKITNSPS